MTSMTWRGLIAGALFIGGCATTIAGPQTPHRTAVGEIQWSKTPFGPLASSVFGDFSTGEHVTYIQFPAGMKTPVHTHSHDYVGIVVSGTTRHFEPGKPETEKELPAGSHWSIPADLPHVSECLPGSDCVMAIYQTANFDFLPVE